MFCQQYKIPEGMQYGLAEKATHNKIETIEDVCWKLGGHPWIYCCWFQHVSRLVNSDPQLFEYDRVVIDYTDGTYGLRGPVDLMIPLKYPAILYMSISTAKRLEAYAFLRGTRPGNFLWIYRERNSLKPKFSEVHENPRATKLVGFDKNGERSQFISYTLEEATKYYFDRHNAKAENGIDYGEQERLRTEITNVQYMGKETNFLNMDDVDESMPGDVVDDIDEGVNKYPESWPFQSPWLIADTDLRGRGLRISIAGPLRALLKLLPEEVSVKKVGISRIATHLDISPDYLVALSVDPPWYARPTDESNCWASVKVFDRFRRELPELQRMVAENQNGIACTAPLASEELKKARKKSDVRRAASASSLSD